MSRPAARPDAADAAPAHGDEASRAQRVEQLLRRLSELPALPAAAARLLELSNDDASDAAEVVRLIESDSGLSVAVLRLLAQLDRTAQGKPTSIERAVLSVGFRQVRDAALAVGVLGSLPLPEPAQAAGLDRVGFWTHNVAVGAAAERLAAACPGSGVVPRDAFLPGLLHDLGKLALHAAVPEAYVRVVRAARRHGLPIAEAEMRVLGLDHRTAGRHLARQWHLPDRIIECVWLHGSLPLALPEGVDAALVHLVTAADVLVRLRHVGDSGSRHVPPPPTASLEALGLGPGAAEEALAGLEEEVATRVDALGLAPAGEAGAAGLLADATRGAHEDLVAARARLAAEVERGSERDRLFATLTAFHAAAGAARTRGADSTATAICTSALAGLDASRCVLVTPAGGDPAASAWRIAETGGPEARSVDPGVTAWPPPPVNLPALLGGHDLDRMQSLLLPASGVEVQAEPPAAILLYLAEPGPTPDPSGLLRAAWSAELAAAVQRERTAPGGGPADGSEPGAGADARLRGIAADAAREMAQPLEVIQARLRRLGVRLDGEDLPLVRASGQAAGRLGEVIEALGMFAHPPIARRAATDAARMLSDAVERVRRARPLRREQLEPLEISMRTGPDLQAVPVDAEMLRRSIDELITNACQAHPQSHLTLRAAVEDAGDAAAESLVIEVSDDGRGLDGRTAEHASDPFFSRHPGGRQAGLGLARVSVWAAAHGGSVGLRTPEGGGCVARLCLPLK